MSPRDTVRLVAAAPAPVNGAIQLGLQFHLAPGWHIYWSYPGDAGIAPAVTAPPPVTFGSLQFPPPQLLEQGGIGDYVLAGNVLLPFSATPVGTSVTASAQWLVCADICVPEHGAYDLGLRGGASAEAGLYAAPAEVAPAEAAPASSIAAAPMPIPAIPLLRKFRRSM